jgi:hypothetical protein
MTRSAATFLFFAGSLYALSQAGDERLPEFEVAP